MTVRLKALFRQINFAAIYNSDFNEFKNIAGNLE